MRKNKEPQQYRPISAVWRHQKGEIYGQPDTYIPQGAIFDDLLWLFQEIVDSQPSVIKLLRKHKLGHALLANMQDLTEEKKKRVEAVLALWKIKIPGDE